MPHAIVHEVILEKEGFGKDYGVLSGGEVYEFAVDEEPFEPAFLATGS